MAIYLGSNKVSTTGGYDNSGGLVEYNISADGDEGRICVSIPDVIGNAFAFHNRVIFAILKVNAPSGVFRLLLDAADIVDDTYFEAHQVVQSGYIETGETVAIEDGWLTWDYMPSMLESAQCELYIYYRSNEWR